MSEKMYCPDCGDKTVESDDDQNVCGACGWSTGRVYQR